MTQIVGEGLGNYIGEFLEYDEKNKNNNLCPFMHICILLEICKHLKKSKRVRKLEGEGKKVIFKYDS